MGCGLKGSIGESKGRGEFVQVMSEGTKEFGSEWAGRTGIEKLTSLEAKREAVKGLQGELDTGQRCRS